MNEKLDFGFWTLAIFMVVGIVVLTFVVGEIRWRLEKRRNKKRWLKEHSANRLPHIID